MPNLWTLYRVRWDFVTKLCGSVPADPEIVEAWIKARKPAVRPPNSKSLTEINEEVFASLAEEEEVESNILTFQRHEGVLCMRAATLKAHLKDCARVLSNQYVGRIEGERAFSTRVINGVYPDERDYWVPILRPDGTPVTKHDGERDKAVHVRGRSALKRFEYVEPARLDFTLKVLTSAPAPIPANAKAPAGRKPSVAEKDLRLLMDYGGVHGYAGERGDGEGKYIYTLTKQEDGE